MELISSPPPNAHLMARWKSGSRIGNQRVKCFCLSAFCRKPVGGVSRSISRSPTTRGSLTQHHDVRCCRRGGDPLAKFSQATRTYSPAVLECSLCGQAIGQKDCKQAH